jgi:hypothetical protein
VSNNITFKNCTKKYNSEVHFRNNKDEPFYRWYPFVEGFSGNFVKSVIKELDYIPTLCLDTFTGSGTTPLACQESGIKCLSFEINPFLFDLTQAKLYRNYKAEFLRNVIDKLEIDLDGCIETPTYPQLESQTLFEKDELDRWIFSKEVAWGILDILKTIENISDPRGYHKRLLKMALASKLLDISNVFRNGKCLSYKPNWESNGVSRKEVHKKFITFCREVILDDLILVNRGEQSVENYRLCRKGDARKLIKGLDNESVDLVITSPPYLNSRDYTDIYRLELWMLGYLRSYDEERRLRRSALRSHVQVKWPDEVYPKVADLTRIVNKIEKHRGELWSEYIPEMIKGYFADMNTILSLLHGKMKRKSKVFMDLGNSCYFRTVIETDAIVSQIAEINGFYTDEIRIARYLTSSGQQNSKRIRESIVVLTNT